MSATYRFNGVDQLNGGTHPLKGVECTLVRRCGMSHAGYDCVVLVPVDVWCARYATPDGPDPREWAEFQDMVRGDHVEMEANFAEELEPA